MQQSDNLKIIENCSNNINITQKILKIDYNTKIYEFWYTKEKFLRGF